MSLLKIMTIVLLQITFIRSEHANIFLDDYETQLEKSLNNKYFIIVNKENSEKAQKQDDLNDEYGRGKYYLILDKNLKSVQRRFRNLQNEREERKQAELVKSQHANKMKVITEFMKDHLLTTNYLYNEVQRIKRQRKVKDDLRRMVEYLENPEKLVIKAKIMKCYYEARKNEIIPRDIWAQNTNNLVINVLKDPDNYGFIN